MGREGPCGCGLEVFPGGSAVCPCGWHDEGERKCPEMLWKMLPRAEGSGAVSANTRMVTSAGAALVFCFVFSWTHLQRAVQAGTPSHHPGSSLAQHPNHSLGRNLLSLAGDLLGGRGGGGEGDPAFSSWSYLQCLTIRGAQKFWLFCVDVKLRAILRRIHTSCARG